MRRVTGEYFRDVADITFPVFHFNVNFLSVCYSCYRKAMIQWNPAGVSHVVPHVEGETECACQAMSQAQCWCVLTTLLFVQWPATVQVWVCAPLPQAWPGHLVRDGHSGASQSPIYSDGECTATGLLWFRVDSLAPLSPSHGRALWMQKFKSPQLKSPGLSNILYSHEPI